MTSKRKSTRPVAKKRINRNPQIKPVVSLAEENPKGRVDVLAYKIAERLFNGVLAPKLPGLEWAGEQGVGKLVETEIRKNINPVKFEIPEEVPMVLGMLGQWLDNRARIMQEQQVKEGGSNEQKS